MSAIEKNVFSIYRGLPKSVYLLFISRTVDSLGSFILPLIALILTQKIGFSKAEAGLLSTAFMLAAAPFLLLGGRLIDRFGSRRIIICFTAAGALLYLPCAFIRPGIPMALLIAGASAFFMVLSPAYNSLVSDIVPETDIKRSYSLLYLGYNLGFAVGPAVGGVLFNRHLNLLFLIDSVTALLAAAIILFWVKAGKTHHHTATGAKVPSSAVDYLKKTPVLLWLSLIMLIFNFAYSQWGFLLPLQSAGVFGQDGARLYSLLVSVNAAAVIVLTPGLTSFTHRFSSLNVITVGSLFYLAAFIAFGFAKSMAVFIPAAILLTVGEILITVNMNTFVAENTPNRFLGRANSILNIVNGAGIAIGPVIMGHALLLFSFGQCWFTVAALTVLGTLFMFYLKRRPAV